MNVHRITTNLNLMHETVMSGLIICQKIPAQGKIMEQRLLIISVCQMTYLIFISMV